MHEIAVLADQRRRAGYAFTSDTLEEWHRYSLPAFTERMKKRLKNHCEDGHQAWPAKGRYTRHAAEANRRAREDLFAADVGAVRPTEGRCRRRLGLVDLDTGEIKDLRTRPFSATRWLRRKEQPRPEQARRQPTSPLLPDSIAVGQPIMECPPQGSPVDHCRGDPEERAKLHASLNLPLRD